MTRPSTDTEIETHCRECPVRSYLLACSSNSTSEAGDLTTKLSVHIFRGTSSAALIS